MRSMRCCTNFGMHCTGISNTCEPAFSPIPSCSSAENKAVGIVESNGRSGRHRARQHERVAESPVRRIIASREVRIYRVFQWVHRGQEVRYPHAGVQQPNKISSGYALALGDLQHFHDRTFDKAPIWFDGLVNIIHLVAFVMFLYFPCTTNG
jgi:hypothetical protein